MSGEKNWNPAILATLFFKLDRLPRRKKEFQVLLSLKFLAAPPPPIPEFEAPTSVSKASKSLARQKKKKSWAL